MKRFLYLFILFLYSSNIFGGLQDGEKSAEKNLEEKIYTQKEFNKQLEQQVEQNLKRLGYGKIVGFSRELLQKEEKLKIQELELQKREEVLANNMQDFENKVLEFKARQNKLINCLDENEKNSQKRIQHMVDVISTMRPQNAAELLSVQDEIITVQLLGRLDSTKVSKIFNKMDKNVSARLQKQYMTLQKSM